MALLFAATLFAASALLFVVEPMVGKMLLPYFGGSPAVWNTCLAFFQAALLAGYAYAHALTRWRRTRGQLVVHAAFLVLPWLVLPLAVNSQWAPRGGMNPTLALAGILCATVVLPFFVVSSTAPLLQQWFASTRHRHAADPYYLYAASNAGSMLGLVAYPALIEPNLELDEQSRWWAAGYALLTVLVLACATVVWRKRSPTSQDDKPAPATAASRSVAAPGPLLRLKWIALAFVPSSLLLGVTAYLSSDVSPVPLIWVGPLALYLLSFILVFLRLPAWVHKFFALALPLLVLAQIYHDFRLHAGENYSMLQMASVHLATFFAAAMVCHGELARVRPAASFLTEYYFWMSLGGVLGGLFNALVAPLIFNSLIEYPLALSVACTLSPLALWRWPQGRRGLDPAIAVVIGLISALILFETNDDVSPLPIATCLGLCAIALGRPVAFGLSVAALFAAVGYYNDLVVDDVELRRRDFYGVLEVRTDDKKEFYYLHHGRIRHGQQRRAGNLALRNVPLAYYFSTSPIGQVFAAPLPALEKNPPVAVIGLGVGSLAYYGQAGQEFTFYEIDPAVERLARDEQYFTYLRSSRADCRVVLGDARLSLADAPDGHYGLIVVDAFSGDAIPVHLITYEAIQLYIGKLAPGGVLAFHISNQFLELAPVLGNLAAVSSLVAWNQIEGSLPAEEIAAGKASSQWVILGRDELDFGPLVEDARWQLLTLDPRVPMWTDHYTSLWGVAHWRPR